MKKNPIQKPSCRTKDSTDPFASGVVGFLCFLIFLVPLIFVPNIYRQFDLGKAFFFKAGMGLVGCVGCLVFFFSKRTAPVRPFRYLFAPILLLSVINVISTFRSEDVWISLVGLYERQIGLQGYLSCLALFVLLILFGKTDRTPETLLKTIHFSALVLALAAIIQYLGWFDFGMPPLGIQRSRALMGHGNPLGDLLVFVFPIPLYLALKSARWLQKGLYLSSFFIIALGIICSDCRGAYIAFCISAFVGLSLYLFIRREERNRKIDYILYGLMFVFPLSLCFSTMNVHFDSSEPHASRTLAVVAALGFAGIVWLFFYMGWNLRYRNRKRIFLSAILLVTATYAGHLALYKNRDQSYLLKRYYSAFHLMDATPRYGLWIDTMALVKEMPFFGIGPEMFRKKFMSYKSVESERREPHTQFDHPHNQYLYVLASLGALGLLLHLWLLLRFLQLNLRIIRNKQFSKPDRFLALGFFSCFVSYAVWTLPGFETLASLVFFWALLSAFSLWYSGLHRNEGSWPIEIRWLQKIPWSRIVLPKPVKTALIRIGLVVLLLLLATSTQTISYTFAADWKFSEGFLDKNAGKYEDALRSISAAMELNPRESFYPLHGAKTYLKMAGQTPSKTKQRLYVQQAEQMLDRADTHVWSPDVLFALRASARLFAEDLEGALQQLEKVLEVYPSTLWYRREYNKLRALRGR